MNKKIMFQYSSEHQDINYPGIVPGKKTVPDWYIKIPPYMKPRENLNPFGRDLSTVKKCLPFFEGLTHGYMLTLPFDVYIESTKEKVVIGWQVKTDGSIALENKERIPGLFIPEDYSDTPVRFDLFPAITTPKGYSILLMHPINRTDLPFYTFGAVMDSDYSGMSIGTTTIIKKDFVGIIEKGTPMAQIFPFKRENWVSEKENVKTIQQADKEHFELTSTIKNSYIKNFWHKKTFN